MIRLSFSSAHRALSPSRTTTRLRLGAICLAVLFGAFLLTGAATGTTSAKISARLTKTSFTSAQAGSVKLVCKFKKKSGSFAYKLTFKKGKKWQTIKSVKKKSYRKGAYRMSVKKVFAGKAVKLGSYRLKISANGGSKLLKFKVIKAPVEGKPVNTSLPTISGTAKQGQTLAASHGSWSKSPTSYVYRWNRCTASGAICADISGATSSSYTLVVGDVGSTIRVVVTAKNAYGSKSAISSKTAIVSGLPPVNTALPAISGTAKNGNTLTASTGTWTGTATIHFSYQWRRCNGSGASCSNISGATSSTHALVPADDHSTMRVVVTASNSYGSANATSSQTAAVSPIVSGVSAAWEHSCALLSDGKVECWGDNRFGQLGNGTKTPSATAVIVSDITNAVQVTSGYEFSCARLADQSVKCWGYDNVGQLGNGVVNSAGVSTPVQVVGSGGTGTLTGVTQISAGLYHACAVVAGGAWCWGSDYYGELGDNGASGTESHVPVKVVNVGGAPGSALSGVTQVSAGFYYTCAVVSGGADCWGYNDGGQLGNGTTGTGPVGAPVQVKPVGGGAGTLSGVTEVSVRVSDTCAVVSGGVDCWGYNFDGELGNGGSGGSANSSTPVQVKSVGGASVLSGATHVSVGAYFSCALVSDGVDCWGQNNYGQLGTNSFNPSTTPVQVAGVGGTGTLASVMQVSAGDRDACSLLSNHTVKCWGDNFYDQLGIGKLGHSETPVSVSGISDASHVSSGFDHACAIRSGGTVWCWGSNNNGQLGNGSTIDSSTPVQVGGGTIAIQVSAGRSHTCALVSGGTVWCWGSNYYGQLGDNHLLPGPDSSTPVQVSGITTAIQVSAGGSHTCAVLSDHTVWCWGYNYYGQLGNNSTNTSAPWGVATPVQVSGITTATQVSAGDNHTCAVLSTGSGTVWCWGWNSYSQLGHGTTTDSSSPVEVYTIGTTALTGVSKVSAGSFHTCAGLSNGNARCWGHNYDGQLGNGDDSSTNMSYAVHVYSSGTTDLTGVSTVSVGPDHSCALLSTNTVDCWGNNNSGQLGIGTLAVSSFPAPVSTLANVAELSAGGSGNFAFSCALISGGAVKCWGSDYYGELGDGGIGFSLIPVGVVGLP